MILREFIPEDQPEIGRFGCPDGPPGVGQMIEVPGRGLWHRVMHVEWRPEPDAEPTDYRVHVFVSPIERLPVGHASG